MEEDHIATELANVLLRRRDLRLKQLPQSTSDAVINHLRASSFTDPNLLSNLTPELLAEESDKRRETYILRLLEDRAKAGTARRSPSRSRGQKRPGSWKAPAGAPPQKQSRPSRPRPRWNSSGSRGRRSGPSPGRGRGQSNQGPAAPSRPFPDNRPRGWGHGSRRE